MQTQTHEKGKKAAPLPQAPIAEAQTLAAEAEAGAGAADVLSEPKIGEELTVERHKFNEATPELIGTYERSFSEMVPDRLNPKNPNLVERVSLYFRRDNGARVVTVASGGLQRAMLDADVQPGQKRRIQWLGKTTIAGSTKTVNNFKIFAA